jgi:anti-anti-sigma factor
MTGSSAVLTSSAPIFTNTELNAGSELVLGQDRRLLDQLTPLVRRQCVALDLSSLRRIDAAGIAALVQLYRAARDSGNSFSLLNVAPRIQRILAVVGLDRILLSHNEGRSSQCGPQFRRSAA